MGEKNKGFIAIIIIITAIFGTIIYFISRKILTEFNSQYSIYNTSSSLGTVPINFLALMMGFILAIVVGIAVFSLYEKINNID
jgi:hypothetical protein